MTDFQYNLLQRISIHALRGEGDQAPTAKIAIPIRFQSTPSVGRATAKTYKYATLCLYIVHIKLYIFATAVFLIDSNSRKSAAFSVRTYGTFYDRCRFALKHKESFRLISGLGSYMLYFCLIVVPEIIKSQTVLFGVDELFELVFY